MPSHPIVPQILKDGLQSAVAIGVETGSDGFRIAMEEYGNACGRFTGVMKGEGVHPHHDVGLGVVKSVTVNGRKVFGGNRNREHRRQKGKGKLSRMLTICPMEGKTNF